MRVAQRVRNGKRGGPPAFAPVTLLAFLCTKLRAAAATVYRSSVEWACVFDTHAIIEKVKVPVDRDEGLAVRAKSSLGLARKDAPAFRRALRQSGSRLFLSGEARRTGADKESAVL